MPTYLYHCEKHGEFEQEHSISHVLKECPLCQKENLQSEPPRRLINSENSFILNGGGWAKDKYS